MKNPSVSLIFSLIIFSVFFIATHKTNSQSVEQLEDQISNQREKLESLNKEIEEQQKVVDQVAGEANTLKTAVNQLTASENKLGSEIKKTKEVINTLELEVTKASLQIETTEETIFRKRRVIAEILRNQYQNGSQTLIEHVLSNGDFSTAWEDIDTLDFFNKQIKTTIEVLDEEKEELEAYQETQEEKQTSLEQEKVALAGEQETIKNTRIQKDTLLTQTKNKESEYRKLLVEKQTQKKAFENELFAYETQLEEALAASEIPDASIESLLIWPVKNVIITQQFGKTSDSGRLYASGTHNGIDIGVSVGTRLYATQSGVVKGAGNTDQYTGCYSYGRWVLIEHDNGLSTLYAHMSSQSVSVGQRVATGDVIGLSGNTGYSTGPHLHFTLFASKGVAVKKYSQSRGCKQASIPLSTKKNAYLDPMQYLPNR